MISRPLLLKLSVCSSAVSPGRFALHRASPGLFSDASATIRHRSASRVRPSHISVWSDPQTVAYSSTANNQIPITV
jgi:hypothetical protein